MYAEARNTYIEILEALGDQPADTSDFEDLQEFLGSKLSLLERPPGMNKWSENWFDNYKFILYELFLYTISVLIQARSFDNIDLLLDSPYFYTSPQGQQTRSHTAFRPYIESLETLRKQRLEATGQPLPG